MLIYAQMVDSRSGKIFETIHKVDTLNKAIRTAYKSNWQEQLADIGDLEGVLETVGKTE